MCGNYENNNNRDLKLIIVNGDDPDSSRASGTKSYVWNIAIQLVQQGINTTVIGIGNQNRCKYPFNFISILKESKTSSYKFLYALFIECLSLKIPESALIHVQRPDDLLPFVIFFRKNPKVCTLHGLSQKKIQLKKGKLIARIYELIETFTLNRTDSIICVDDSTKEHYINKYPWIKGKLTVIPVGIDLTKFKPLNKMEMRKKYCFSMNDKIVMYVGRLEKEKNIEFIISSLKHLSHKYKFVVVGDGTHKDFLKNFASSLDINHFFVEPIPQEQMPEILNCADVLVISSLFESGPLVAQEAIACGVPVVSVDVGRVKEFILNDNIGLICNRNVNEFAKAIDKTLDKKDESLIEYRKTIARKFSFESTAISTLDVFNDLIFKRAA